MGLISWIKDTYYNHKLDNADSAYQAKDIVGAERIYQEILDKQPEAAEHLAKMYYEVGKSRNDELAYLAKLKSLFSNPTLEKGVISSYLNQLVLHIERTAELLFKECDYNKAYKYLKAIDLDKRGDANFAKKCRLYALYVSLNSIESGYSYTSTISLIDDYCKVDVELDIEDAIIGTVKRLHESNKLDRAYCTSNCLARKGNSKAVKECVAVAYDIYKRGKKSEISVIDEDVLLEYISQNNRSNLLVGLEQFAKFSDKYKEKYISEGISVISSEPDAKKAFSIFKNVWETSSDVSLIQNFAKPISSIAKYVYQYFEGNISSLTSESTYQVALFKELSLFEDYKYVLSVLEGFKRKGLDNRKLYISTVKSAYDTLNDSTRLSLINRLLQNYNDDTWGISEKLMIGERAQAAKNYALSSQLYNELVGLHAKAQPRLAQLYYELSQKESDFKKRRSLIEKAFSFKKIHAPLFDSKEYNLLIPNLSSSVHGLVKECFNNNTLDEAYTTVKLFKNLVSDCFDGYIKELKLYHDVHYVLSKLESLKNEGYDVHSDYKEVVIDVTTSKNYDDKYKLEVLSKSIELYTDNDLSEKFIKVVIDIIRNEKESDGVVVVFAKAWKQLPNSKLLVAFVNQNYKFHTSIVDFLIDKSSLPRCKKSLVSDFCDQIFAFDDYKYSLSVFDRISAKGIDVQKAYVACVLKALPSLAVFDRLSLLDESLAKYSDEYLVDEKMNLCNNLADEGKIEDVEKILIELIGLHKLAEPKLAALYLDKSKNAKTLDCRLSLIQKGLSFHISHSSVFDKKVFEPIFIKLLSDFTSIIEDLFSAGEHSEAYNLCEELKLYSKTWYTLYLKLRTEALSMLEGIEDKITHLSETFSTLNENGYKVKDSLSNEVNSLWDTLHNLEFQLAKSKPYKACVQQFTEYSEYVNNQCNENKASELQKDINNELIAIHKSHGYKCEQEGLYSEAISTYIILSSISEIRTKTWCKVRCVLCNIKEGKFVEEDEVRKILAYVGFAKEKKDLAYRYSLYLIANKGAKESLSFVSEHLPEESELIAACNNAYIKEAEALLEKLNQTLDRFKNSNATLSEAEKLEDCLEEYDQKLSPYLSGVHSKIVSLRPAIHSYMLSKCFEKGNYNQALKYLKASGKNWYEDNIYFRNVAIACLGIVENGKLNKLNYKAIISCWLTAVYRDQLFVKSLDYTSWDDAYTFTLDNSLGGSKSDSYESLPENVGYDEPVDGSVISISEVQQSLLDRFEVALNDKDEIFKTFFEEQKNAMDALVKLNLDHPCIIAAPYMANTTKKCFNEIKGTLDYEYDNYGGENILKVGILYNINTGVYSDYKEAAGNAQECVSAAKSMMVSKVRGSFTGTTIDSIREFSDLYGSFITEIQNVLSQMTKSDTPYKTVLNVFSIICQALNDNTVAYIFGNYINQSIVGKLNDESLDLTSGLKDLLSAYKVAKSCSQLKNNIGNVLEALVGKYITEANASDLATIKSVLASTGTEFESNIANTLSEQIVLIAMATGHADTIEALANIPARSVSLRSKLSNLKAQAKELSLNMELSQVVEKVNNNTMSYSSALQKVYSIYKDNKDNSRVCDNLCTLIGMCIREYVIPGKSGKSTVMSVFNELKYNKSATYRTSAAALKKERQEILDQLPLKARILLTGGSTYGSELNAEGIKLKNALQLYLDLA